MGIKFANNAATALNGSIDASTTTFVVDDGTVFPTLGGGDHCYASIENEIVKITAISTNTLTVVRGQDGTTAAAHDNNTRIEQRINAASLNDLSDEHDSLAEMSGDLDDIADGTTYVKMTAAQSTKLDGIEAGADVTDSTNVLAALVGQSLDTGTVTADGNMEITGGISFDAGSNYLDDYEEGTFSLYLDDTNGGSETAGNNIGTFRYTKTGRIVHIEGTAANISTSGLTAATNMYLRNFPFQFAQSLGFLLSSADIDTQNHSLILVPSTSSYNGVLRRANIDNSPTSNILTEAIESGSADIWMSITYTTDS